MRKFVRRNRPQVVAAGLLVLALVAGVIGTSVGLVEARRQERAAWDERDAADAARRAEADQRHAAEAAQKAEAEQRRVAEEKAKESDALVKFFEERVFAATRPKNQDGGLGHDVKLREAIAAALPGLADGFKDQPLVEARLRMILGITFGYLGDARAVEQFERARTLYTERLGPDHPGVLPSMHNLAVSYAGMGRYQDALELGEAVVVLSKRIHPPDHPDTLMSMSNLSGYYAGLGRDEDALKLDEDVLAARMRVHGRDHPNTLDSMTNLAASYDRVGRHRDALELEEGALAGNCRVRGPDHPRTLDNMINVAASYAVLGRHLDALRLRKQVLDINRRVRGPDHPATLDCITKLAVSYTALGQPADALKLYAEAIAAREHILAARSDDLASRSRLGGDYLDTGNALKQLGRVEDSLPAYARAVDHLRVVLAREPNGATNRLTLRNAHGARAEALDQLGRHADAAVDWDKVVELDDGRRRGRYRAMRANSWVRAGRVAEAVAEAADLTKSGGWPARNWYDFACVYAVASDKLPDRRDELATRAVELLRKAVAAGYRDRAHMDKDADLDPLRGRPDFRTLVESLPYTAPPPREVRR